MPLRIPTVQTGLEASIQAAAKSAGKNLKINLGTSAKSIEGLSQPLGRITGKADQFTKSMEAANARVLAFGASVGVLSAVTRGFRELINTTVEVEKSLASINSILGGTTAQLDKFKSTIFEVARNTEQSFDTVANAALELSRQGLKAEEITKRLNDAMILSRLSGLGASEAVAGLTAALNSFKKESVTSVEVLNKLSAASVKAAVSERDLIEAIKRSGSVAQTAGVSLNELIGVVSAVQEKTARGGAVIGNSFKTIFTRIQSLDKLETMQKLGVQVTDASGDILSATKLIQNLAKVISTLPEPKQLQIAENLVGKFQIAPFLAILDDYNSKTSKAIEITSVAANATNEAYSRNVALNETLSAAINQATVNLKELANTLGEIGVTDSLQNILGFFNSLVGNIQELLKGEGIGSDFARGIVKGIGGVLSGPGLAIFGAIIAKLTIDLVRFGTGSLTTFFGLNKAAKQQATLQGQIASTLLGNKGIQERIMAIENSTLSIEQKRAAQIQFFTVALNEQMAIMTRMQSIAGKIAPGVMAGTRGGRGARSAGGFIPNFDAVRGYSAEQADINKGVGGVSRSAKPVVIPNFNFGGGQKGTMIANTGEFIVPNYAGGGSAIFNPDMVENMGLPTNAKKIRAGAGGYIPNFAKGINARGKYIMMTGEKGKGDVPTGISVYTSVDKNGARTYTKTKPKGESEKINVPVYTLPQQMPKGALDIEEYTKQLKSTAANQAVKQAKALSGGQMPEPVKLKTIGEKINKGALSGFAGTIYELTLASLLTDEAFKQYADTTDTSPFDLALKGQDKLIKLYGASSRAEFAEVKGTSSDDNLKSAASKIYRVMKGGDAPQVQKLIGKRLSHNEAIQLGLKKQGSRRGAYIIKAGDSRFFDRLETAGPGQVRIKRGSRGFIPNFAQGPLQEAVNREIAAGLPVNQIRINQDGALRSGDNPLGLAVTNTRDEPLGAVPNFAKGPAPITMGEIGTQSKVVEASLKSLNNAIKALNKDISKGVMTEKEANVELKKLTAQIKTNAATRKKLDEVAKKRIQSEKQTTGQNRDYLGAIFAVSAGLAALQGATSDAEGGIGRFVNRLSEGLQGITTAAFASSAISSFGQSLSDGGKAAQFAGKSLKMVGGLGMVVGTAVSAVNMFVKMQNDANGVTDVVNLSLARMADAADNAAVALNKIGAEELIDINAMMDREFGGTAGFWKEGDAWMQKSIIAPMVALFSKDINLQEAQEAAGVNAQGRGFLVQNVGTLGVGGQVGTTVEQEKAIREAVTKALGEMPQERRQTAFDNIVRMIKRESGLKLDAQGRAIGGENMSGGGLFGSDITFGTGREESVTGEVGRAIMDNNEYLRIMENIVQVMVTSNVEKAEQIKMDQEAVRIAKEKEALEKRMSTVLFKEELKHAAELAKMSKKELEDIDEKLFAAEQRGILSKEAILDMKVERKGIETNLEIRNKTIDTVVAIAAATKDLTVQDRKLFSLRAQFQKLVEEGVDDEENRNEALRLAKELLEGQNKAVQGAIKPLTQKLEREEKELRILERIFGVRQNITKEVQAELRARQLIVTGSSIEAAKTAAEAELTEEQNINKVTQRIQGRQGIPRSDREARAARILDMQDQQEITRGQNALNAMRLAESERKRLRDIVGPQTTLGKAAGQQGTLQGIVDMINKAQGVRGKGGLVDVAKFLQEDLRKDPKFREQFQEGDLALSQFIQSADDAAKKNAEAADAATKLAAANLKAARLMDDLTFGQLIENMEDSLTDPQNIAQARIDRLITTDPTQRIQMALSEDNRDAKAKALAKRSAEGLDEFREILEQEEFTNKIVDSSVQFAQNIGDAMVMAVARGEDLGTALRSAASDFFLMLSKAFMQRAINNIVGLGTDGASGGGGGWMGGLARLIAGGFGFNKKNEGGSIRGGSGIRDDVPALLTGGEFVLRKSAVQKYGSAFLNQLNSGAVPTLQRGGYFTPGTFGQGEIRGKGPLLDFATQGFTSGELDQLGGGANSAYVALEPHSVRMTRKGISMSRLAQTESASQGEALSLYFQQIQKDKADAEARKQQKRALRNAIIMSVASAAFSGLTNQIGKNFGKGGIEAELGAGASGPPVAASQIPWYKKLFMGVGNFFGGAGSAAPRYGYGGTNNPPRYGYGGTNNPLLPTKAQGAAIGRGPTGLYERDETALSAAQIAQVMRNAPDMGVQPRFATGGSVPYRAGIDTVPTMLSGGEFVMNAAATQSIGRGNLAAMNSGAGGDNREVVDRLDQLIDVSGGSGETVINITVNSDGRMEETQEGEGGSAENSQQTLARRIRDQVRQVIDEEKRLGGSLRTARSGGY